MRQMSASFSHPAWLTWLTRLTPLCRFMGDRRGVSAVEFALIAPIMVAMYLGAAELTQVLTLDRKVTSAANAVADLVAVLVVVAVALGKNKFIERLNNENWNF